MALKTKFPKKPPTHTIDSRVPECLEPLTTGCLSSTNLNSHEARNRQNSPVRVFPDGVHLRCSWSGNQFMRRFGTFLLVITCTWQGCITPHTTHFPSLSFMPSEYERREAQIHDPFPDASIGPDTGNRPPNFRQQRSEVLRAQDKYFAALRRQQSGAPFPVLDPRPRTTGKQYPAAVER